MVWSIFKKSQEKSILGIDVGSSAIKIVELTKEKGKKKLINYGFCFLTPLYEKLKPHEKQILNFSPKEIAKIISAILLEAKIKNRKASFSLPDFATFITNITLPLMSKEEAEEAIKFEAKKYIPLPLSEVTIDWLIFQEEKENLRVLLVAVPNEVINYYLNIANSAQLELISLEAEIFSLIRAFSPLEKPTVIIDIGSESVSCNLIDKNVLKISHSFDVGSAKFSLEERMVNEKKKEKNEAVVDSVFSLIAAEAKKVIDAYYHTRGRETELLILSGGGALFSGLKEYLVESFKKEVKIANPFENFLYPQILNETLKEIGPILAVSVGVALKELNQS